jgi:hypothetical protein
VAIISLDTIFQRSYILVDMIQHNTIISISVSKGVLVGKPEGKRPLGRPRCRWVDNITADLQEVGCRYMEWIGLAQDRDRWWRLVGVVMNFRVP